MILGLKKVLWEGAELYRKEGKNKETLENFGAGTPDDWIERKLYTPHTAKGIFLMLAIDLLLFWYSWYYYLGYTNDVDSFLCCWCY